MNGPAVALLLLLAGAAMRITAASRPGLWGDEIFSLAMATGHSLEHPAAEADPARGDFVEPPGAQSPGAFRRYAEQETPAAGAGRIVRAVLLSDTNPPLYYLLLDPWTRVFGTGDAALRFFSVWWSLLALPLLWLLGRDLGGVSAAWPACVLFAWSPVALYYSAEGRMYSLLWFFALSLGWLTLRLAGPDARPAHSALWLLAGAAGFLTHYFFAFVWLASTAWLWLRVPGVRRRLVAVLGAATLLIVSPWYLQVPASLARWRVSGAWLNGELSWPGALGHPLALAGGLLSGSSYLGGWEYAGWVVTAVLLAGVAGLVRRGAVREMFTGPVLLLWAWLAAACLGPLVFDLLRHTTTSEVPRYVLAALPAAILLAALLLSRLPAVPQVMLLGALLLAWLPGARRAAWPAVPRPSQPYRQVDARLLAWAAPGDLILVSSTPSGVVGVARYLDRDVPMASWVPQLETRPVEPDLRRLLAGRRRVALVKITHLGDPAPAEPWLAAHARRLGRDGFRRSGAEVSYYAPAQGDVFFPQTGD